MSRGHEVPLSGGNIGAVVRVGSTVRRPTGQWTPAVHALLRHLESKGFRRAPQVLGVDDEGREVLTYLEGEQGYYKAHVTRPDNLWSDEVLVEAARLLRQFHDATLGFDWSAFTSWQQVYPDPSRNEVVCHNDYGPYNCIFSRRMLMGIIDFDTAGPGPRAWDVAYGAYRFVPLATERHRTEMGVPAQIHLERRLRLFCDAYELDDRTDFLLIVQERIAAIAEFVRRQALAGYAPFQALLEDPEHLKRYTHDISFIMDRSISLQHHVAQ